MSLELRHCCGYCLGILLLFHAVQFTHYVRHTSKQSKFYCLIYICHNHYKKIGAVSNILDPHSIPYFLPYIIKCSFLPALCILCSIISVTVLFIHSATRWIWSHSCRNDIFTTAQFWGYYVNNALIVVFLYTHSLYIVELNSDYFSLASFSLSLQRTK